MTAVPDKQFHKAVEAIDAGDIMALQSLLQEYPTLITKRLETAESEGYFKDPYLIWYVADNPIRHEKLPANIVDVTEVLIEALQQQQDANYAFILNYTLGLVATGRIPKECGLQIPLMEILIAKGASVNGSVLGPIGQRNLDAAKFLLSKGAGYNLATAIALQQTADANRLLATATPSELFVALTVAAFFGDAPAIDLLLRNGAQANGSGSLSDFGGFHSHASPLHQAVFSGSLEAVKLLVDAGADLNARDMAYDGTPLNWAEYMPTEGKDAAAVARYKAIEKYLSAVQR
ncbi:ankyrin repeat domain-containing protein [Flavihumibacter petaseus]|uniref:Uncharacterized protein n=1 Tax=Flavihumibacter petaseus NBRC 106054 TaxID=1220578 RepID=A0A0E9N0H7_9BACT|nr:ankyrin repeat domain-containing protein [Flavihumibacter petaseus]GAO43136.1 hypothetical protein FPE01S_02_02400 [Flavihumibacter petaseus NBRC 106054]